MHRRTQRIGVGIERMIITTIAFSLGMLVFITSSVPVTAVDSNISVFPPGSKPYGLTYGQWSIKWFQWALSIPNDKNPINDDSESMHGS
jgi:hypothetical protein